MKKLAIFVLGLVALVSLSGCAGSGTSTTTSQSGESLKKGTFVAVKWQDQNYYLAVVQKLNNTSGKYILKFADDTEEAYAQDLLTVVPPKLTLKAGDAVSAAYPATGRFYPAKVTEVNELGVMIDWDDGSPDSLLPQGHILLGALK